MKRRTKWLLSLSITLIVIGTIGSIISYQNLDHETTKEIQTNLSAPKRFTNKKLVIQSEGPVTIKLQPSKDEQFHLSGQYKAPYEETSLNWEIKQDEEQDTFVINFKKDYRRVPRIFFDLWDTNNNYLTLTIPKQYEHLITQTYNTTLQPSNLTLKTIQLKGDSNSFRLNNIKADSLKQTATESFLALQQATIKDGIYIEEASGASIKQTQTKETSINASYDDIDLSQLTGKIKVRTEDGQVRVHHVSDEVSIQNKNGNTFFYPKTFKQPAKIQSSNGSIYVWLNPKPTDLKVEANSPNGEVSIFGKEQHTFETGHKKPLLFVKTTYGDIHLFDEKSEEVYDYPDFTEMEDEDWFENSEMDSHNSSHTSPASESSPSDSFQDL